MTSLDTASVHRLIGAAGFPSIGGRGRPIVLAVLAVLCVAPLALGAPKLPQPSTHVADYATLAERVQDPFCWAARDVARDTGRELETRPLFGIPGNHDYYDFLDGFNRQFRKPFSPEVPWEPGRVSAQLHLPGFERRQQACFLGLALPFGWRLWGLDAQGG